MITGPCGVGKTWLACALGQRACRDNLTVIYQRLPRLFADLELAHGDGRFPRLFRSLVKADLLILDDWGGCLTAASVGLMKSSRTARSRLGHVTSQRGRACRVIGEPTLPTPQ